MRRVRAGCHFLIAMFLGAVLLTLGHCEFQRNKRAEQRDKTLNQEGAIPPRWLIERRPCRAPDAREAAQDAAMATLAQTFASEHSNPGLYYVVRYFGWHWPIMKHNAFNERRRCPPTPEIYARIAPVLERANWLSPAQDQSDLRLIERLPPSRYLAQRLADMAFNAYPLTNGPLHYDNRPYARMLLGYQGAYARPWAARAFAEIAPDTKLGTSAAFLAVAIAPDQALPRVEASMRRLITEASKRQVAVLDLDPPGRGFTIRDGDRFYELAHALSMGGERAEPYSGPLVTLLDRRFGAGSHFGLILIDPKGLCPVARHIGGRAAAAADRKAYCNVGDAR